MSRKNRKYVDDLLKDFDSEYKESASQVITQILDLLSEGKTVNQATSQAFRDNNYDYDLQHNLEDKIYKAACYGYGIAPEVAKRKQIISKLSSLSWSPDGMTLSDRLHHLSQVQRAEVNTILQNNLKNGTKWVDTARDLYDGYRYGRVINQADLPSYLAELQHYSKQVFSAGGAVDKELLYKYNKSLQYAKKLGDSMGKDGAPNQNLKTAYKNLITEAEAGSEAGLNKAVYIAVQEKSRYNAERISRTEIARAWTDGFYADTLTDDDVIAYKYKMGSRHPKTDICDVNQDSDICGLGRGIYKKDLMPRVPAHCHCLCHILEVYRGELDDKKEHAPKPAEGQELEKPSSRLSKDDFEPPKEKPQEETPKETPKEKPEITDNTYKRYNNTAQAEKWAKDNLPIDYINYSDFAPELADDVNETLQLLYGRYPEMAGRTKILTTSQDRNKLEAEQQRAYFSRMLANTKMDSMRDYYRKKLKSIRTRAVNPDSMAESTNKSWDNLEGIAFNRSFSRDYKKIKQATTNCVNSGFHPLGTENPASVLTHEYGHQVHNLLLDNDLDSDLKKIYTTWITGSSDSNYIQRKTLSEYANVNYKEFVAEAFSEYIHNPNCRPTAKAVGDAIERAFKKLRGET